jgi:hypothetical protein
MNKEYLQRVEDNRFHRRKEGREIMMKLGMKKMMVCALALAMAFTVVTMSSQDAEALDIGLPDITFNSTTVLAWGGTTGAGTSISFASFGEFGGAVVSVPVNHLVMFGIPQGPLGMSGATGEVVDFNQTRSIFMDLNLDTGTGTILLGGVADVIAPGATNGFGLDGETAALAGLWTGFLAAPDGPVELSLTFETGTPPAGSWDINQDGDSTDTGEAGPTTDLGSLFGGMFGVIIVELNQGSDTIASLGGFGESSWAAIAKGDIGPVPEPGTILLMLSGAAGLLMNRKIRKPTVV